MRKKLFLVLICAVLAIAMAFSLTACDKAGKDDQKTIVYLGDSIAEAILGPSPISARMDYGYYSIIGQRNGYKYINHSVSGHRTAQLLEFINREDDGARQIITNISKADILHISILGNDLLQEPNLGEMFVKAAAEPADFTLIDAILDESYENIKAIVARLRVLNPNAVIIFQNVYNPVSENSTLLNDANNDDGTIYSPREELAALGYEPKDYRALGDKVLNRLNGPLYRYLEEVDGDAFHIIDAHSEFNRIYNENADLGKALIYPDYVHPSNFGHAVLADLTQSKLEELGLAEASDALASYKTMRITNLSRYFAGSVDLVAANNAINGASDCKGVTSAYFNAIMGKTPVYAFGNGEPSSERAFSRTRNFEISKDTSIKFGEIELKGFIWSLLIDFQKSGVVFNPDGTMKLTLIINSGALATLQDLFNVSISSLLAGINVTDMVNTYVTALFPGFTLKDIPASLDLIKNSMGISFVGLDYESDGAKALFAALAEGNFPDDIAIPDGFGLQLEANYYTAEVDMDGVTHTAVCIGNYHPDTHQFIMMDLAPDENGNNRLNFKVDFLNLHFVAEEEA